MWTFLFLAIVAAVMVGWVVWQHRHDRDSGFGASGAGGEFPRHGRPIRGSDVHLEETVDFVIAALGGTQLIRLNGRLVEVRIPAAIDSGARLALRGMGGPGLGGGSNGDAFITVTVAPHPLFRREAMNVVMGLRVSPGEALLGTTKEVMLLRESVRVKVPPGTTSGQRLRLAGNGLRPTDAPAGDFLLEIQVDATVEGVREGHPRPERRPSRSAQRRPRQRPMPNPEHDEQDSERDPVRVTHCWSCKQDLDSRVDTVCGLCGGITCGCGACLCGRSRRRWRRWRR
jgi:DnaJ-class molecular chaperone